MTFTIRGVVEKAEVDAKGVQGALHEALDRALEDLYIEDGHAVGGATLAVYGHTQPVADETEGSPKADLAGGAEG